MSFPQSQRVEDLRKRRLPLPNISGEGNSAVQRSATPAAQPPPVQPGPRCWFGNATPGTVTLLHLNCEVGGPHIRLCVPIRPAQHGEDTRI